MDPVLGLLLIILVGGLAFTLPTLIRDWQKQKSHKAKR